ncbi:DNA methyltransferase [Ktedonobacteria bacterium brp13]|nr:DNA methyltransferase [Ktedonobacteria bacterium brp13]
MSTHTQYIVQKLWNYCNILRDDGMSYGDYVEQLTYLLFLKMADEQELLQPGETPRIPEDLNWQSLCAKDGDALESHYRLVLEKLGREEGMLGVIFRKAINKIQNPAHLRRLIVDLIGGINWLNLEADVKGDAYEGLLEKNAEDTKSGAGQYFTPRELIRAIVEVMQPSTMQTICDPACGTGGFLLAAHDYISAQHPDMDREASRFLKNDAFQGWEIVDSTARLCVMNMFLHGIGDEHAEEPSIHVVDSLRAKPSERFDMVLSNPPFGRKSSLSLGPKNGKKSSEREAANISRDDFWATTSNKQLNFVQHIYKLLKTNGRAAVVVPDNVLFEGGAGETIRRNLLQNCDVHTMLRLPTGIFYAQGVKANVLFFDKHQASFNAQTEQLWVYDLRTNMNFTLRTNPLKEEHLADFITCYNSFDRRQRHESERFRCFSYEELSKRDKLSLDLFWLRDQSLEGTDNLPPPAEIAASIIEDLQNALEQFMAIADDLGGKSRQLI